MFFVIGESDVEYPLCCVSWWNIGQGVLIIFAEDTDFGSISIFVLILFPNTVGANVKMINRINMPAVIIFLARVLPPNKKTQIYI
jgi:hypothetical protein